MTASTRQPQYGCAPSGRSSRALSAFAAGMMGMVAGAGVAEAQAPVSGVHTTMGPGAGLSAAVTASGGYATSVPLDLPSPRTAIPVPLSVVERARNVDVEGLRFG